MTTTTVIILIAIIWSVVALLFVMAMNSVHQQDDGETVMKGINNES